MRHGSFCRSCHPGRRGIARLLRCEPLEHRWLLSITVDTLVDEADGSIDDGDVSLRDAIAAAVPGETIDFDSSLDGGTIQLTRGELVIERSMTIDATALPAGLTIDASGNDPTPEEDNGDGSRIFLIDDGEPGTDSPANINGLTLTGGDVDAGSDGGAVHSQETLAITSTTISGNSSPGGLGGGIYSSGDVTVANSRISGNSMGPFWGFGGGIYARADLRITESTISGNSATGYLYGAGGGVFARANVTITGTTVSGNMASDFGGGEGGGIVTGDNVALTIVNSIVAGNITIWQAPDILLGTGQLSVQFSLIGGNTGTGLPEAPVGAPDANGNLIGDPSGMGIIDPMLGPLTDNGGPTETHAMLAGSPGIDAGDPEFAPPPDFDQRGNPRVADGDADGVLRIDMGAVESLRGDLNGDGEVNGLDVDSFVDVLLGSAVDATADMNADGNVNGLDADAFVEAVLAGSAQRSVRASSLQESDTLAGTSIPARANRFGQVHSESYGEYPLSTRSGDRGEELGRRRSRHTPDVRTMDRRVSARRARIGTLVGRDSGRSPREVIQHKATSNWQAAVERALEDDTIWIAKGGF